MHGPRRKRSGRYANAVLVVQIFRNIRSPQPRRQIAKIEHDAVFLSSHRAGLRECDRDRAASNLCQSFAQLPAQLPNFGQSSHFLIPRARNTASRLVGPCPIFLSWGARILTNASNGSLGTLPSGVLKFECTIGLLWFAPAGFRFGEAIKFAVIDAICRRPFLAVFHRDQTRCRHSRATMSSYLRINRNASRSPA